MCEPDRRIITTLKYSKQIMQPTIVNGHPAARGQMPYLVSIKEPVRKQSQKVIIWLSLCGASIIGLDKVLTAAHCFETNNFYYYKHFRLLRLVAGNLNNKLVHSGDPETSDQAQWRSIKKLVLHHDFMFPENDIALMFLDIPWNFTNFVNAVIPATRNTDYPSTCYSSGFGRTGHSLIETLTPVLLQARIDVMERSRCSMYWEMNMNRFICTGSAVTDVGIGDSGGPLACRDTLDPAEEYGKDLLVGVVSGKNYDKTTLFTRVSAYRDWIETNSGFKIKCKPFLVIITFLILKYHWFHWKGAVFERDKN